MCFFPPDPDSPSPEGKRSASIADGQASTAAWGIYKYIHFQVVKTNLPRKAEWLETMRKTEKKNNIYLPSSILMYLYKV